MSAQEERIAEIVRKFQRSTEKMNMGVTISSPTYEGGRPVHVTVKCPHCEKYVGNLPVHIAAKHPGETS